MNQTRPFNTWSEWDTLAFAGVTKLALSSHATPKETRREMDEGSNLRS